MATEEQHHIKLNPVCFTAPSYQYSSPVWYCEPLIHNMKYKRASLIDFVVDPPVEIVKLITRINSTPAFLKDRNDLNYFSISFNIISGQVPIKVIFLFRRTSFAHLFSPSLEVLAEKTGMALSLALIYHSNPAHQNSRPRKLPRSRISTFITSVVHKW